MGAVAGELCAPHVGDAEEQLCQRIAGVCASGHCDRHTGLESHSGVHCELHGDYTVGGSVELCDRRVEREDGTDAWRIDECEFRQRCRIDRECCPDMVQSSAN